MKRITACLLALILVLVSLPVSVTAEDAGAKSVSYSLTQEEWAVQKSYSSIYLYAENVEGLQSGTVVIGWESAAADFLSASEKSEFASCAVRSAGLIENPYYDSMSVLCDDAAYWTGESGKKYAAVSFMMNDAPMHAVDVAPSAQGRVPIARLFFRIGISAPAGDFDIEIVNATAEVNDHMIFSGIACSGTKLHLASTLKSESGFDVDYTNNTGSNGIGGRNGAGQHVDERFSFPGGKVADSVSIVNFDPPPAHSTDTRLSFANIDATRALGASNPASLMIPGLRYLIFGVPMVNLDTTRTVSEYPYSAFKGLPLANVDMEFTENELANSSRYFTDDGIIYIREPDSDACRIYFIPPEREKTDIYLSDAVTGFYTDNNVPLGHATLYWSAEKLAGLTFHIYRSQASALDHCLDANGKDVPLHVEYYEPQQLVEQTTYSVNSRADTLTVPFRFNDHTFRAISENVSASGNSVTVGGLFDAAVAALKAGRSTLTYTFGTEEAETVYTLTIALTHTHEKDAGVITVPNSCTTSGKRVYTCVLCGQQVEEEEVPATGHTSDGGKITKAPTCTETGVKTYTCTTCKTVLSEETVPATGHTPDGGKITKEPTCTETGVRVYTCTVCHETTDTQTVPAKGHDMQEIGIVKAATCRDAGVKRYTCSACGLTEDREYTDGNAHIWTGRAFSWKCSVCGTTKNSISRPSSSYRAPTIVDPTEPTETEPPTTAPTTVPPTTVPPTTEPPTTAPTTAPTTVPPTTVPPTTIPPTTVPPTTVPPTVPPTTVPPTTEPPTTIPSKPPITTPSIPNPPAENAVPEFSDSALSVSAPYILGVVRKTVCSDFKARVKNPYFTVSDTAGRAKEDTAMMATGDVLAIRSSAGAVLSSYTIVVLMDIDGNGRVNSTDGRLILRYSARLDPFTDLQMTAADADANNRVNSADARMALRAAANLI